MSWGRHHRRCLVAMSMAAAFALVSATGEPRPSYADGGKIVDRRGRTLARQRGAWRDYPRGELAAHALIGVEKMFERSGHDLVLTLDLDLQKVAQRAVAGHEAAAVAVVEVDTGRILALVSTPSFEPSAMASPAERARLESDPRRPLLDRTVEQDYPPASTFKLITAVAALESDNVTPEEEMTCTGSRTVDGEVLLDMGVHGTIDFLEALQHSCNVYFWALGERVGVDRLARVARDFGFGAPTGLLINRDLAGRVPDGSTYRGQSHHDVVSRLGVAIGAADVRATVLQVAMAYAALANGGRLYVPQLVRRVQTARGRVVEKREPVLRRRLHAPAATLDIIRRGLWRAVNTRGGTAFAAKKGVVKMVGKTGTTPVPDRTEEPHAWFAGWAPAGRPRIAVVVLIEHGGVGGAVAAPVARDIIDAYFSRLKRQAARAKAARAKAERAKAERAKAEQAKAKRAEAKKRAQAKRAPVKRPKAKRADDKRRR